MRDTATELHLLGDIRRARVDQADKGWLAEESRRSDRESRERMECLTFVSIMIGGASFAIALYDWTQDMAWARALVALIYQVGPV